MGLGGAGDCRGSSSGEGGDAGLVECPPATPAPAARLHPVHALGVDLAGTAAEAVVGISEERSCRRNARRNHWGH